MRTILTIWAVAVCSVVGFWAFVAYVAFHFIHKFW